MCTKIAYYVDLVHGPYGLGRDDTIPHYHIDLIWIVNVIMASMETQSFYGKLHERYGFALLLVQPANEVSFYGSTRQKGCNETEIKR